MGFLHTIYFYYLLLVVLSEIPGKCVKLLVCVRKRFSW